MKVNDLSLNECYLQSSLEGADGQQSQVLLLLRVPHQVNVHQLLQLQMTTNSNTMEQLEEEIQETKQTVEESEVYFLKGRAETLVRRAFVFTSAAARFILVSPF